MGSGIDMEFEVEDKEDAVDVAGEPKTKKFKPTKIEDEDEDRKDVVHFAGGKAGSGIATELEVEAL